MDPYLSDFEVVDLETTIINNAEEFHNNWMNNKTSLSIFHCNIRSVSKNFDEICIFLSDFDEKEFQFHAIIFTETRHVCDKNFYALDGYQVLYNEGQVNQNDGVLIYVSNKYKNSLKYTIENFIHFKINTQKFSVIGIYRPYETCPKKV